MDFAGVEANQIAPGKQIFAVIKRKAPLAVENAANQIMIVKMGWKILLKARKRTDFQTLRKFYK